MEKQYNSPSSSFWTDRGDKCTVLGDVLGRIPAIDMLSPKPNEIILDVGCGAGWCTRRIARTGATAIGFDVSSKMLEAAKKSEQQKPLGITYLSGDLTQTWPIESNSVDAVACIAVLMHANPEEVQHFFREARRVLRRGGQIAVSLSHRDVLRLQEKGDVNLGWVYHETGTWDKDGNALAIEHYFDIHGHAFVSPTWMHNLGPAAEKAGFVILEHHDRVVTREVLRSLYGERSSKWPTGYAAFEQILAC